jgi:multidrug efflux pump
VPKGFFPQQDNGRIQGSITADQDTSFQAMDKIMLPMINIVAADPAVDTVNGFTGGSTYNTARLFISLKAARTAENLGRPHHRAAAA